MLLTIIFIWRRITCMNVDMDNLAIVIDRAGSIKAAAAKLDVTEGAVRYWLREQAIPRWRQKSVIKAAAWAKKKTKQATRMV